MTPNEEIIKLKEQLKKMQEIILAIVMVQETYAQFKLRKMYPELDKLIKKIEEY